MWLFDKQGFVSVVAYDPAKDRDPNTKFTKFAKKAGTHLLVRARIKEDLDMLKSVVPSLHVETDPSADYSFRCVITRKDFKKFLANAVDGIDYWSHFKEAARDNSPKAEGRYSAMMKVWTVMADLQPYSPYGGGFGYGSSYGSVSTFGNVSSGKYGSVYPSTSTATPKSSVPSEPGFADMEAFLEAWQKNPDLDSYRRGNGPRTGFQEGDAVFGYHGEGEVTAVKPSQSTKGLEMVTVKQKTGNTTATTHYASNYLIPVLEVPKPDEKDLAWVQDQLTKEPDAHSFPIDVLPELSEAALELLIRVQEEQGADAEVSSETLKRIAAEVEWEFSTEKEKEQIIADGSVPEKFVNEALTVFSHKA